MSDFFSKHSAVLEQAILAIRQRGYWSAYPEAPSGKIYGETAKADAEAGFAGLCNAEFPFDGAHPRAATKGKEVSPYGLALNISYPTAGADELVAAVQTAMPAWAEAGVEQRAGICLEILARLNAQSFLIANAVMHTTGQAFMMAFQAGGPHAQDRALEAVAYAVADMRQVPADVTWEKPQGKADPLRLHKRFRIVPRGIGLVIGCATFPTWNGYPGLFASLVTGNGVIVKPHPGAVLPLALTVKIAREVLQEQGFDPNVIVLAVDEPAQPITQELALHSAVAIIDFTGGPVFGRWLREHVKNKALYTEEAGINSVIIDSTSSFTAMCDNLAFSLVLYSGQMCTAPQNIFVPRAGIETAEGRLTFDQVAQGLAAAVDRLLADPARAVALLGALQNPATLERVNEARRWGKIVRESKPLDGQPDVRSASPLILSVDAKDREAYLAERFGPIAFVIATESTEESLDIAVRAAREHGAITAAVYSTKDEVLKCAEGAFAALGVALSINLTGQIFVNQSAAFSDYHVSGANPAGNACLTDTAFVANRYRVAPSRRLAA